MEKNLKGYPDQRFHTAQWQVKCARHGFTAWRYLTLIYARNIKEYPWSLQRSQWPQASRVS